MNLSRRTLFGGLAALIGLKAIGMPEALAPAVPSAMAYSVQIYKRVGFARDAGEGWAVGDLFYDEEHDLWRVWDGKRLELRVKP